MYFMFHTNNAWISKKNMYYFQHNSDEILTFKNKSPTYVFTLLCFVLVLYMYIWWFFCTCLKEKAKNWLYVYKKGKMHHNFNTLQRLVLIFYKKKPNSKYITQLCTYYIARIIMIPFIDKNWIKNYWKKFWNSHSSNLWKMKSRTEK